MALLLNGPIFSSCPSPSAGVPVVPRRSRTVLLYSSRVRRRAGVRPAFTTPLLAAHAAANGSPPVVEPVPAPLPAVPVVEPVPAPLPPVPIVKPLLPVPPVPDAVVPL